MKFDVTLITDGRYLTASPGNSYEQNVVLEDKLLQEAIQQLGLTVNRTNWDNPNFNWATTKCVVIRATWDYFERITEFRPWLEEVSKQTQLINSYNIIDWNIDKFYLKDLHQKGINIPPTIFINKGEETTLQKLFLETNWDEAVLKPAIAGGAFETYKIAKNNITNQENNFSRLIVNYDMLLQEFQYNILSKGEISLMCFDGKYSHAILKRAKGEDYRVQDDFGGTVHDYTANAKEIAFAEEVLAKCGKQPVYARVDILWDNNNQLALGELELIEPELWLREDDDAPKLMAEAISNLIM